VGQHDREAAQGQPRHHGAGALAEVRERAPGDEDEPARDEERRHDADDGRTEVALLEVERRRGARQNEPDGHDEHDHPGEGRPRKEVAHAAQRAPRHDEHDAGRSDPRRERHERDRGSGQPARADQGEGDGPLGGQRHPLDHGSRDERDEERGHEPERGEPVRHPGAALEQAQRLADRAEQEPDDEEPCRVRQEQRTGAPPHEGAEGTGRRGAEIAAQHEEDRHLPGVGGQPRGRIEPDVTGDDGHDREDPDHVDRRVPARDLLHHHPHATEAASEAHGRRL